MIECSNKGIWAKKVSERDRQELKCRAHKALIGWHNKVAKLRSKTAVRKTRRPFLVAFSDS